MLIEHGARTGKFRLGGDSLITDEQGKSQVPEEAIRGI
jgi:putative NADH-flavin reductase